jgi:hypothetical protein
VTLRPLVRRIYANPREIRSREIRLKPDPTTDVASGFSRTTAVASQTALGPYIVSGGWWGGGVRRDYYFAPTSGGNLWWVYYDHRKQRFFLQGCVE